MSILFVTHIPGMTADVYDGIVAHVGEPLRAAPGFRSHQAAIDADGATVYELWDSAEQAHAWFDEHVKPNLPAGAEPKVVELHRVLTP